MEFTAQLIAEYLKGKIEGDPHTKVTNVSKIEEGKEGSLAFLANPKYEKYLYTTKASIVLINNELELKGKVHATLVRVDNAYESFASLLQLYVKSIPQKTGIEEPVFIAGTVKKGADIYVGAFAYIGENVEIGDEVKIYPQAFIDENVKIGKGTVIYPGARIYKDSIIGADCVIHAGAVIGADGFGFAPQSDNNYKKIPQIGNVVLEDHVEIGANATIDRATMGSTVIRKGVKLDNMVHLGHNVEVGENTVMAAQSGIAGSTKIGKNCMFGGQVGAASHITVADGVMAAAQTGIASSVKKEKTILMGAPAFEIGPYKKSYVIFKNLPELYEKIRNLEEKIKNMENR